MQTDVWGPHAPRIHLCSRWHLLDSAVSVTELFGASPQFCWVRGGSLSLSCQMPVGRWPEGPQITVTVPRCS
eukprot:8976793-Pyramimonas_sp.AAC.1